MISKENLAKIGELQYWAQWSAQQMFLDLARKKKEVTIAEAFRSQDRQNILYCQGRTEQDVARLSGMISPELRGTLLTIMRNNPNLRLLPRVTWTLKSRHTERLALDICPINCTFDDLKESAALFGITQPLNQDRWHHEFMNATHKPLVLSVDAQVKRHLRAIARATGEVKKMLERTLARLYSRIQ